MKIEGASSGEKTRMAYIEGRSDLFETKILKIKSTNETKEDKELLVSTRDPGSANALLPVLKELTGDQGLQIDVITDGRAEEIIKNNFKTEDITPEGNILEADSVVGTPNVILMDRSSEMGIDTYVSATFPEVPKILVEDYYANTVEFLTGLIERGLPLPEKICVMDEVAKKIIIDKFPQLERIIEVTGQPAFDKFVQEDTEKIAKDVKGKLGLKPNDKLVSFMSTGESQNIELMAEALKGVSDNFYFAFRRHPRDNVSYDVYEKAFLEAGIQIVDTNDFPTNDIGAASDVVLTTWSTEGLHGIYRRKPTAHITDSEFASPVSPIDFPLPPVKLGASIGINKISEMTEILSKLLNPDDILSKELMAQMEKQYPADGKNSERVANIVRQYLK